MYENPWMHNGVAYNGEGKYYGFVYLITDKETGKKYVGRKYMKTLRKQKKSTRRKSAESDWRDYYSSNEFIKNIAKVEPLRFSREILHLCETKGKTNFLEVEEQFCRKVLWSDDYLNDNINGKWYKENVKKYLP